MFRIQLLTFCFYLLSAIGLCIIMKVTVYYHHHPYYYYYYKIRTINFTLRYNVSVCLWHLLHCLTLLLANTFIYLWKEREGKIQTIFTMKLSINWLTSPKIWFYLMLLPKRFFCCCFLYMCLLVQPSISFWHPFFFEETIRIVMPCFFRRWNFFFRSELCSSRAANEKQRKTEKNDRNNKLVFSGFMFHVLKQSFLFSFYFCFVCPLYKQFFLSPFFSLPKVTFFGTHTHIFFYY